ncbi:hypothetical protein ACA593_14350 [Lactiplantibacillus pentosus]
MSLGDLFKVNEYKNTIQESQAEITKLQATIEKLKQENDIKLSLQQMKPE